MRIGLPSIARRAPHMSDNKHGGTDDTCAALAYCPQTVRVFLHLPKWPHWCKSVLTHDKSGLILSVLYEWVNKQTLSSSLNSSWFSGKSDKGSLQGIYLPFSSALALALPSPSSRPALVRFPNPHYFQVSWRIWLGQQLLRNSQTQSNSLHLGL